MLTKSSRIKVSRSEYGKSTLHRPVERNAGHDRHTRGLK